MAAQMVRRPRTSGKIEVAAAKRAKDVARVDLQDSTGRQSRVWRLTEYTRRRVIMCSIGEFAEGGKLVGLPSHHSQQLL